MSDMPWDRVELRGWSIVGMNHYHVGGIRRLFVAMTKDGHCIKAEGTYEPNVWKDLAAAAYALPGRGQPRYDFYVNDQKHQSEKSSMCGLELKALAHVEWPQQLFLEEDGQVGDRCIADKDYVDLKEKVRRFYLVPSAIIGG